MITGLIAHPWIHGVFRYVCCLVGPASGRRAGSNAPRRACFGGFLGGRRRLEVGPYRRDRAGILDFLHKRSGAAVDKAVVNGLIKQLADPGAAVHDGAAGQLTALGESAVPALREAVNKLDDPDFAARARQCLLNIDDPQAADLSSAVVRAAAQLRPDGVVDALLEYLPFAENDKVAAEVQAALVAVAPHDGKPPAALLRALTDPAPVRRAAAAVALCQLGGESQYAAVRPLLKDPKPTVRLRAALALADAHCAEAVPVIIDLLAELPLDQRRQAEDFLTNLAGDWAVTGPTGNDLTSRRLAATPGPRGGATWTAPRCSMSLRRGPWPMTSATRRSR